jgi:hypothetical protein
VSVSNRKILTFRSERVADILGVNLTKPASLPFSAGDVTAGSETELQAAVFGSAGAVDLPLSIRHSNYFANVVRRAAAGDTPRQSISRLQRYLEGNEDNVWENSWVRLPRAFWDPLVILFHQTIWLAAFVFHGRSKVTGSEISIHVRKDLI